MSKKTALTLELGIVTTETNASTSTPVKIVWKESAVVKTVLKDIKKNYAYMVRHVLELPPLSFSMKTKYKDQLTHLAFKKIR